MRCMACDRILEKRDGVIDPTYTYCKSCVSPSYNFRTTSNNNRFYEEVYLPEEDLPEEDLNNNGFR